jgi:hypothetical protein
MNNGTALQAHRVTAVFRGAKLSFDLARDATLAKLAEHLCSLGESRGALPLAVKVRVATGSTRPRL